MNERNKGNEHSDFPVGLHQILIGAVIPVLFTCITAQYTPWWASGTTVLFLYLYAYRRGWRGEDMDIAPGVAIEILEAHCAECEPCRVERDRCIAATEEALARRDVMCAEGQKLVRRISRQDW